MSRIPEQSVSAVYSIDSQALREAQRQDVVLSKIISAMQSGIQISEPPSFARQANKLLLKDGVLCRTYQPSRQSSVVQVVIPVSMRDAVLQQLHDAGGHLGVARTLSKVKERFYWPGYEVDVEQWVKRCEPCQRRNSPPRTFRAELGTITSSYPFEKISWDITGPLPVTSNGNKYILVVTDLFTKWVEVFPLQATDSETLATVLANEVVSRYGIPTTTT